MAFNRFNRYRRRPRPIKPIRGNPYDNIPKWLYEKTKKSRDPIEGKTRKTKEKKINIPNLQKTLTMLKNKTNEMIQWITRIPIIERRMTELEDKQKRDTAFLLARIEAHAKIPTPIVHSAYSTAARAASGQMKRGGRFTKPIPSTNRSAGGTTNKGQTIKVGDVVKDMNST
tara:strand:+ start:520 stop:1032 length:513 start_codon:yes stop_codon:yes gene_type:complete